MTQLTWDTATELDAGQQESNVHHEQPTGTDWAPADVLELGYPTSDQGGTSLEGYWPLDEDSGTTANDVSGNTHDGTLSGPTVGQAGILGSTAFSFDGTDDVVDLNTSISSLEGASAITLSAWVTLSATTSANGDDNMGIYGFRQGWDDYMTINYQGDAATPANVFRFHVENGGTTGEVVSNTYTTTGEWKHIVGTFDGGTVELYVDGVSQGTATGPSTTPTGSNDHAIGHLQTGGGGGTKWPYNGRIDEVRVYSRALTATEVSTLADVTSGQYVSSKKVS